MLDKLMLQDVRNVLEKLKIVKESENVSELLERHGIDTSLIGEELDKAIVANMMSDQEYQLFTRYIKYKRYQNLNNMKTAIDCLAESKVRINNLYNSRKKAQEHIEATNSHMDLIMEEMTLISAEDLLQAHFSTDALLANRRYLESVYISKQKSLAKRIDKVKTSKLIIPTLKAKIVNYLENKLRKMIEEQNDLIVLEESKINESRITLETELDGFCSQLMDNPILFEAFTLNEYGQKKQNVTPTYNSKGVRNIEYLGHLEKTIIFECLKERIKTIIHKNPTEFNFANKLYTMLTEIYQNDVSSLKDKKKSQLSDIQKEYARQQELIQELGIYQSSFELPQEEFTQDEQDTLSIAYKKDVLQK